MKRTKTWRFMNGLNIKFLDKIQKYFDTSSNYIYFNSILSKIIIWRDYEKPAEITPYPMYVLIYLLLQNRNPTEQTEISDCNQIERCCTLIHFFYYSILPQNIRTDVHCRCCHFTFTCRYYLYVLRYYMKGNYW